MCRAESPETKVRQKAKELWRQRVERKGWNRMIKTLPLSPGQSAAGHGRRRGWKTSSTNHICPSKPKHLYSMSSTQPTTVHPLPGRVPRRQPLCQPLSPGKETKKSVCFKVNPAPTHTLPAPGEWFPEAGKRIGCPAPRLLRSGSS